MHDDISKAIQESRKIVIKIGSNTLAKADGTQNTEFMADFARQCADLIKGGKQIVLVSSGAQVAGVSTTKEWARKKDVHYRQALCSIGQVELMHQWRKAFQAQNLHIGQLLLTKDDFENEHRSLNIRNTLFTLVDEGVIPIINENDSVSFDEIKIGEANSFGTGGIETKIQAAEKTTVYGIPLLLANGSKENALENLKNGLSNGTLFLVE